VVGALIAHPLAARADDCAASYERAQEHRTEGRLRSARAELLVCTQSTCATFIKNDCRRWLEEVDTAMPTVVFVARVNGKDSDQVRVSENNEPLALRLDGRSMALDPGKHTFTFEAPGAVPVTVQAMIGEGQKNRTIEVDLRGPSEPVRPKTAVVMPEEDPWPEHPTGEATERSWLTRFKLPLIMAGVGAAGFAAFAAFGKSGLDQERRLKTACAPACDGADVQAVRDRYLLADIGLGIGVASLATAGYFAFRELSAESGRSRVAWTMRATPRQGVLIVKTSF
jgi:hypothetical protein